MGAQGGGHVSDVGKRKKRKRSLRAYVNLNRPVDENAEGLIGRFPDDDDSPGAEAARVALAEETKAGRMPENGPRRIAWGHPDLRQSNTDFSNVIARLRTVRGNTMDAGVDPATPGYGDVVGDIALRGFEAASQAGSYRGMPDRAGNGYREDYHIAPLSATAANPCYPQEQYQATSNNPMSAKQMRDIMRDYQRRLV